MRDCSKSLHGARIEPPHQVMELAVQVVPVRKRKFEARHPSHDRIVCTPGAWQGSHPVLLDAGRVGDVQKRESGLQFGSTKRNPDSIPAMRVGCLASYDKHRLTSVPLPGLDAPNGGMDRGEFATALPPESGAISRTPNRYMLISGASEIDYGKG